MKIKPYVPIVRWRPAELLAIEKLYDKDRNVITPLIEFVMPPPKFDKEDYKKILEDSRSVFLAKLPNVGQQLLKAWGRDPVFVDVHLLDGDIRATAFEQILTVANALDIFSIPVTYIIPVTSTDADIATRGVALKFARLDNRGVCIRLDLSHLKEPSLSSDIENFITNNGLSIENSDILVDLRIVDEGVTGETIAELISQIPHLGSWRSFIVSGGAFPKDLSEYAKHENHKIRRHDLLLWNSLCANAKLSRTPTYSDYTIQHPIFYGNAPGRNPSASIRYTGDDQWEIFRGEGLRNKKGAGHKQYPAHAQLLIEQPFYKGAEFSFGDSYIADRGSPTNVNNGNPTTWLTAGINHHVTLTARQISNPTEK